MDKKIKVSFAPGCFDNFDGTQEELDEMVSHIKEMFSNMTEEDFESHPDITSLDLNDPLLFQPKQTRH